MSKILLILLFTINLTYAANDVIPINGVIDFGTTELDGSYDFIFLLCNTENSDDCTFDNESSYLARRDVRLTLSAGAFSDNLPLTFIDALADCFSGASCYVKEYFCTDTTEDACISDSSKYEIFNIEIGQTPLSTYAGFAYDLSIDAEQNGILYFDGTKWASLAAPEDGQVLAKTAGGFGFQNVPAHTHADYASSSHNHNTDYAPISHNHDDIYYKKGEITTLLATKADQNHNHADYVTGDDVAAMLSSYSLDGHNHEGVYSTATHNHDDKYAEISHDHDSDYVNINGDTISGKLVITGQPDATNPSLLVNPSAATTGFLFRVAKNDVEMFEVDFSGNTGLAGNLDTEGNITAIGDITANSFYGDGSHLTNIAANTHNHQGVYQPADPDLEDLASDGILSPSRIGNMVGNVVMITDAEGKARDSAAISVAELGYLDNVTSSIQTQLDGKSLSSHNHSLIYQPSDADLDDLADGTLTASRVGGLSGGVAVVTNGSGLITTTAVTSIALGYVAGVTSSIQTQLDGKSISTHNHTGLSLTDAASLQTAGQTILGDSFANTDLITLNGPVKFTPSVSGGVSPSAGMLYYDNGSNRFRYYNGSSWIPIQDGGSYQAYDSDLDDLADGTLTFTKVGGMSASVVMITNASGQASASAVTATELGYLSGVTAPIQSQFGIASTSIASLNADFNAHTHSGTYQPKDTDLDDLADGSLTSTRVNVGSNNMVLVSDGAGQIVASSTINAAELNYLDGVTNAIQTQFINKADANHNHLTQYAALGRATGLANNVTPLVINAIPLSSAASDSVLYVNASSSLADYAIFGIADGNTAKFKIDREGDVTAAGVIKGAAIASTSVSIINVPICPNIQDNNLGGVCTNNVYRKTGIADGTISVKLPSIFTQLHGSTGRISKIEIFGEAWNLPLTKPALYTFGINGIISAINDNFTWTGVANSYYTSTGSVSFNNDTIIDYITIPIQILDPVEAELTMIRFSIIYEN